ncbi:MAG: carboxypeptidase-like regulatory domain-containing protein [Opitutaceae bacterium]|nr:carboxypeptidase-like regulatory domain-containing protein [Opitutaceae bacterium]
MKHIMSIALALLAFPLFGSEVRLRVLDEDSRPISNADTLVGFAMVRLGSDVEHIGVTDQNGLYSAVGEAEHSVYVRVRKNGYYDAQLRSLPRDRDLDVTVVLPMIVHPIPLHARRIELGESNPLQLLKPNEWLDFDFEVGDMVAPYGVGKVSDIRFKFTREFTGWNYSDKEMAESRQRGTNPRRSEDEIRFWYGRWEGNVEISFPSEKEGLAEEKRFLPYSRLKLPREAPADGYVPTWHYAANSYDPVTARSDIGFFLRTRVKLDKDGNIISANYAKVFGDFRCDARGLLSFMYYFNPMPNDRNLEFDPKRNLFPPGTPGVNVSDP